MTAGKILFGQVLLVLTLVVLGTWTATEWTAWQLGFQRRLGAPWFRLQGVPVYYPWRLFEWWFVYEAYAPRVFNTGGLIAGGSGLLGALSAILGSVWRARQSRLVTTYGSARWATPREVAQAGLTQPAGVFLGRVGQRYLRHDGPEHVMAFAPTRSGKGVGLVVPTLLTWAGSAVIHDIKGENWQLTAGWRSKSSHCLLFNPTDARPAAYNPLLEVRQGIHEVRDVQNIADILVDPEGALERRKSGSILDGRQQADVNARFGLPHRTALMQAAEVGNLPAVIYLVGSGADVNVKNDFGGTALYHARNHSRAPDSNEADKIAEYLMSKGATE